MYFLQVRILVATARPAGRITLVVLLSWDVPFERNSCTLEEHPPKVNVQVVGGLHKCTSGVFRVVLVIIHVVPALRKASALGQDLVWHLTIVQIK